MKRKMLPTQQINQDIGKVRAMLRHIRNVHENCLLLGERLIERGEIDLGRRLITRSPWRPGAASRHRIRVAQKCRQQKHDEWKSHNSHLRL